MFDAIRFYTESPCCAICNFESAALCVGKRGIGKPLSIPRAPRVFGVFRGNARCLIARVFCGTLVVMIPPAKPHRVDVRKRKRSVNPAPDLADLIDDLGAEAVLAAHIIRQAVEDLKDARAGKVFKVCDHPYAADPLGELRTFFGSAWFAQLAAGLGQDPADVIQMTPPPHVTAR
jgi:hypothetical protein